MYNDVKACCADVSISKTALRQQMLKGFQTAGTTTNSHFPTLYLVSLEDGVGERLKTWSTL